MTLNLNMFLGLTQTPQKNAEAHLLSLVLASGMKEYYQHEFKLISLF